MNQPMKVLLVQRQPDQGRLRQALQREFELDEFAVNFEWRRIFSESELRLAAGEYCPTVVISADEMHAASARDMLSVLRLLSLQAPQLRMYEVADDQVPWVSAAADIAVPACAQAVAQPTQAVPQPAQAVAEGAQALGGSADSARRPAILRNDLDAVLMLDDSGWITDLNPHARRLLGIGVQERPRAQAHLQDLIFALQAAGAGRCTTLPLVALKLDGLLLLNAAPGECHGDAALDLISTVVQPQYARCGLLARIAENQYLAKLPHMSQATDAAVSVSGGRPHTAGSLVWSLGAAPAKAAPVKAAPVNAPANDANQRERTPRLAADLGDALHRQALSVHFQPQYELARGRGCGVEALARWTLPSGRCLAPDAFIPVAERSGKIRALDAWILKTACTTALRWRGAGGERLTLSVNVADREIGREHALALAEVLQESGFPPHRLELEIGEGPMVSNTPAVRECLQEWKQLGVRIAVSHRTANYSSLDYLSRTSVDRLKLNKSLIHGMTQHPGMASTVQAIIALGAELKVEVIAEGVETPSQLAMLEEFNCPQAQGFLLARPMPGIQAQVVLGKTWGNLASAPARCVSHSYGAGM